MCVYGCVWVCMGVYGCVWVCMGVYGCVWVCVCVLSTYDASVNMGVVVLNEGCV